MRILLIMDPGISVPPQKYGGIERVVSLLATEYGQLGHEVTLMAGPDSYCNGETITYGVNMLQRSSWQKMKELFFVWKYLIRHRSQFDMVHNFGRLLYFLPILNHKMLKIMSYQRAVTKSNIRWINKLLPKNLVFTACSHACKASGNIAGEWHAIYNTVDFGKYDLAEQVETEAPLIFLGRLEQIKGAHTAIQVAKISRQKLWIAGNISENPKEVAYYHNCISRHMDGTQIQYLGALDDHQKNHYLRRSKALLFPIEWDEPFGIVMVEAMACGTPVIAFGHGAVPEVIEEAITGFITNNMDEMIERVESIEQIDRKLCRLKAQERFDIPVIAKQYLALTNGR